MGVDKVGIVHVQGLGLGIHHHGESDTVVTQELPHCMGCTIVARQHHAIKKVVKDIFLALLDVAIGSGGCLGTDCDNLVEPAALTSQDAGHHLGHAGRIHNLVGVLAAEDGSSVGVYHEPRTSAELLELSVDGVAGKGGIVEGSTVD